MTDPDFASSIPFGERALCHVFESKDDLNIWCRITKTLGEPISRSTKVSKQISVGIEAANLTGKNRLAESNRSPSRRPAGMSAAQGLLTE